MADDIRNLTLRVKVDGGELRALGADFGKIGNDAKNAGGKAEAAWGRVTNVFSRLGGAVRGAAKLNLLHSAFQAIKNVVGESISQAASYQQALSRIVSLTGASREQVGIWEDQLKSLGPRTGKGLGELSDALSFISSEGFRGAEAMNVLEMSAKASTAGLGKTKDIAHLVTSAMNAYGKENLSAAAATDILVAGVREGRTEAAGFATALEQVLPTAQKLGVGFDQVTAAVASLTGTGLDPDEAAVQLETVLKGIESPSPEAKKVLEGTGFSFAGIQREIRENGLIEGLEQLKLVSEELGEEKFARLFERSGALADVLGLLGENSEHVRAALAATADSTGATQAAFDEASKTTQFLFDVLKSRLQVALLDFGTFVLPVVNVAVKGLTTVVGLLNDAFTGLYGTVKDVFSGIWGSLKNTASAVHNFITRGGGDGKPVDLSVLGLPEGMLEAETPWSAYLDAEREAAATGKEKTEAAKGTIEANSKIQTANDELNKSLQDQIKELQGTARTFGLTRREIIEYEKQLDIQNDVTKEAAEKTARLKLETLELEEAIEGVKKFDKVSFDLLPEPEKLRRSHEKTLAEIEAVEKEFPERAEEAKRARLALEAQYAKEATKLERRELIERLKNSDSFHDQMRGQLTEFRQEVAENGNLMSNFFADTLRRMRDGFSDLFHNVITGKFRNLVDVARNTWNGILRSFTQMLAQMATQRLLLKIIPDLAGSATVGGVQGTSSNLLAGGAGGLIGKIPGFGEGGRFAGEGFFESGTANFLGGAFGAYNIGSSFLKGDIAGGVGSTIGGAIGAGIASFIPGIGTLVGFGIGSGIGKFISGFFRKKPKLDIDVLGQVDGRATQVRDLIDESLTESLIRIKSRKTGIDYGELREKMRAVFEGQLARIQGIINTLPADLADSLNEKLLSAKVDVSPQGQLNNQLLGFYDTHKSIGTELQKFLEGELQGRLLFAVRDSFFKPAFEALGVSADRAGEVVDEAFSEYLSLGGEGRGGDEVRRKRAELGEHFLALFATATDTYNFLDDKDLDPLEFQVRGAERAAKQFGFEGIPSLEMIDAKLKELLRDFNDPEALAGLAKYRQELKKLRRELTGALVSGISSAVSMIGNALSKIQSFGRISGRDAIGFLREGIHSISGLLDSRDPSRDPLSIEDRQNLLATQHSNLQQIIALEREKFDAEVEAAQKVKSVYDSVVRLGDSIKASILSLRTGSDSPLSAAEKVGVLFSEQSRLEGVLAHSGVDTSERVGALDRLRAFFPQLASAGAEFGSQSAAHRALFFAAERGLGGLLRDETFKTQGQRLATIGDTLEREFRVSVETQAMIDDHSTRQSNLLEDILSEMRQLNNKVTGSSSGAVGPSSRNRDTLPGGYSSGRYS